jgi:hypothetical protein
MDQKQNPAFGEFVEGTHELSPMQLAHSSGERSEYPFVAPLITGLDCQRLMADFQNSLSSLSPNYLNDRRDLLGCSFDQAVEQLQSYGFSSKYYQAYSLMQVGTTDFLPWIPAYTLSAFEALKDKVCRAHYAIAMSGWESAFHIDTHHFRQQGFRLNLPISGPAYYTFRDKGRLLNFELAPGTIWFINAAYEHQGSNPQPKDRVAIICQLMGDTLLGHCRA